MHRLLVLLLALTLGAASVAAQSAAAQSAPVAPSRAADSTAVLAVVQRVFDAMRSRDSAVLRSAFAPDARMMTPGMRNGAPVVSVEPVDGFVRAVGQPSDSTWDERIYNPEVRIDGNLATVWTEYDFYFGSTFTHCGVDAFQLARFVEGWKIVSLADTRQRNNCPSR